MLGVLVGVVGSTGWAWADCGALRAAAATAQSAAQTGQLESIYEQVRVEPSCDEAFRTEFGRLVGRTIEREVYAAVNAGQPLAGFEPKLVRSLSYARQWRPLAWLGDITRERRQYEQSCGYYQDALAAIQDETATPKPPPKEVIEKIFHLAEETRLLAKTYVAPPKTRAGTVTGLGAPSVRGFVPHKVAVPVEYEFDSTAFTTKGQAAAEDLASQLRQQTPTQPITLIGHTDPRGDDAYNRPLSKRRALALRQFLVQSGVQTEIIAEGRGSDEPAAIDDASKYTQDERYQLDRRVEVQR
jgi:outer membrane protein OmpA-like peptidoglycan-associated protein